MKKIVFALAIASVAFVSCKKGEDASSKINADNVATPSEVSGVTTPTSTDASTTEVNAASNKDGVAVAEFNKSEHDFGTVKKGSKNETEFIVTNNGNADLVIINASATCGCTVPDYPKTPIKPGSSAPIKVAFSANSAGAQSKTVTLTTNTATGSELLTVKANVEE